LDRTSTVQNRAGTAKVRPKQALKDLEADLVAAKAGTMMAAF
jgi:hypothetical protein